MEKKLNENQSAAPDFKKEPQVKLEMQRFTGEADVWGCQGAVASFCHFYHGQQGRCYTMCWVGVSYCKYNVCVDQPELPYKLF